MRVVQIPLWMPWRPYTTGRLAVVEYDIFDHTLLLLWPRVQTCTLSRTHKQDYNASLFSSTLKSCLSASPFVSRKCAHHKSPFTKLSLPSPLHKHLLYNTNQPPPSPFSSPQCASSLLRLACALLQLPNRFCGHQLWLRLAD